jgi:TRAP-type mannitol/chloroaromatic compound transport system permease small subunit
MEKFLKIIDRLSEYQGKVFSILLVVATFQICLELTLRYAFNAPTDWGLELTEFFCAATYVMAGAYAYRYDAHIRVDILYMNWSRRKKAMVDLFVTNPAFFIFCGVLVWESGKWFAESLTQHITTGSIWDPPIWPMRLILFLGSLTLFLQGTVKFIRDLREVFGGGQST